MKLKFFLVALSLFTGLLFSGCSKSSGGYGSNNPPPPGGGANTSKVSMSGNAFVSASLTVKAGTTVTWTNNDYTTHTVTADDNSFTSGDLGYGGTYSHTFSTKGTFSYYCKYHSGMTGTVTAN